MARAITPDALPVMVRVDVPRSVPAAPSGTVTVMASVCSSPSTSVFPAASRTVTCGCTPNASPERASPAARVTATVCGAPGAVTVTVCTAELNGVPPGEALKVTR